MCFAEMLVKMCLLDIFCCIL